MQLFLVTSPAAFLAFNYILYGRLVRNRVGDQYSYIHPRIVARVFIISDVVTFMIQVHTTPRFKMHAQLICLLSRVPVGV